MPITTHPAPEAVSEELAALISAVDAVDGPTLGHYLEEGFCCADLRVVAGERRVTGRAVTVRTTATDSTLLHHVTGTVTRGDVLVVDTGGDRRHAPLGEVVAEALLARGAAGVVVDGVVTDLTRLRELGLPVWARGTSMLTTKLHGLADGALFGPVVCGGVVVTTGDVVVADANGVLVASPKALSAVVAEATADDAEEPALIKSIRAGKLLGDLTGATAAVLAATAGTTR